MAKQPAEATGRDQHYFHEATVGTPPPHFSPLPGVRGSATNILPVAERVPSDPAALEKTRDVELDLTIELGRAEMSLEEAIGLRPGMVVPLDKLAGDLADVIVDGRLVARGELVTVDGHFCVRVVELIAVARAA